MMALMEERQLGGCQQWLEWGECMVPYGEKKVYIHNIHDIYIYTCIQSVIISKQNEQNIFRQRKKNYIYCILYSSFHLQI